MHHAAKDCQNQKQARGRGSDGNLQQDRDFQGHGRGRGTDGYAQNWQQDRRWLGEVRSGETARSDTINTATQTDNYCSSFSNFVDVGTQTNITNHSNSEVKFHLSNIYDEYAHSENKTDIK